MSRSRGKPDLFWLLVVVVPPLLIFPNLDSTFLWQDEAEAALLGRSILEHGVPVATSGVNVISDHPGRLDLNESGIWIWTSWLHSYVIAASFGLLGESTFAARLPFAIAGWALFLLAYACFLDLTGDRTLSRLAVALLVLSVPFLLHARQSRYYMLLAVFSLLYLWGYARLLRGERHALLRFSAAGILLYYSFFPQLVASTLAMGIHVLARHRRREVMLRFGAGIAWIGGLTLPFFVYTASWSREYYSAGFGAESLGRFAASLRAYQVHVHAYCWPFLLVLPLFWRSALRERTRGAVARSAGASLLLLMWLWSAGAVTSPVSLAGILGTTAIGLGIGARRLHRPNPSRAEQTWELVGLLCASTLLVSAAVSSFPFFRYLIGVAPLFALASAGTILAVSGRRVWVAVGLGAIVLLTDVAHYAPLRGAAGLSIGGPGKASAAPQGVREANGVTVRVLFKYGRAPRLFDVPLRHLHRELVTDYDGPLEAVTRHLWQHADPDDVVAITYEHFPLMFYTELRVVRDFETRALGELPEWIVMHSDKRPRFGNQVLAALSGRRYVRSPVAAKDFNWENIPEPYWHRFETPRVGPDVKLFRLRE